jgi:hypothetical protein
MEEDEDPGSSSANYSLNSNPDPYQEETNYKSGNTSLGYPPSYELPDYNPSQKTIKTGTKPKTEEEKIEDAIEPEENPSLDNIS